MAPTKRAQPPIAVQSLLGDVQRAERELRAYLDGVAAAELQSSKRRLQRARVRRANNAIHGLNRAQA